MGTTKRADTEDGIERCPWHDTLVETLGRSGKNGRVGTLEKKVLKIEQMQFRLVLLTCTGSVAGGGLVAGIIKLLAH